MGYDLNFKRSEHEEEKVEETTIHPFWIFYQIFQREM